MGKYIIGVLLSLVFGFFILMVLDYCSDPNFYTDFNKIETNFFISIGTAVVVNGFLWFFELWEWFGIKIGAINKN